jgi:hypothetical protein
VIPISPLWQGPTIIHNAIYVPSSTQGLTSVSAHSSVVDVAFDVNSIGVAEWMEELV